MDRTDPYQSERCGARRTVRDWRMKASIGELDAARALPAHSPAETQKSAARTTRSAPRARTSAATASDASRTAPSAAPPPE
eukprot:1801720-Pleurochrysis_carterae.AAC.3